MPGVGGLYDVYGVVFEPATMSLGDVIAEPLAELYQQEASGGRTLTAYAGPGWAPNVDFIGYQLTDENEGFGGPAASGFNPSVQPGPFAHHAHRLDNHRVYRTLFWRGHLG